MKIVRSKGGRRRIKKKWTKKENRRSRLIRWATKLKDEILIKKIERRVV